MRSSIVWLALVVPSLSEVHRYGGWLGVAAYLAWSAALVALVPRLPRPRTTRAVRTLALVTLALVVLGFAIVYPRANVHEAGAGSDDDDAHNVAVAALLEGASPYGRATYLGNPLHQLPGAFVMALPFVLAGTSALQNLAALVLFFLILRRETLDEARSLGACWLLLGASPALLHQIATGTGHFANAAFVLAGVWWVTRSASVVVPAVAVGIALASRANFLMLLPLLAAWWYQCRGPRVALRGTLIVGATVLALVLPFYLADPAHFGPLAAADRLTRINRWLPHGGELAGLLTMVTSVALALAPVSRSKLLARCAIVLALPILLVIAVEGAAGYVDFAYWTYGLFALPFVVLWAVSSRTAQ